MNQYSPPLIDRDFTLWFGKYKGKLLKEVIKIDPIYISWCLDKKIFKVSRYLEEHIDKLIIEEKNRK